MPNYLNDSSVPEKHWPLMHMSGAQKWLFGATALAVAVAAAPFVLPALEIGTPCPPELGFCLDFPDSGITGANTYEQGRAFLECGRGVPTGLAGQASHWLGSLPLVGETLAEGGIWNGIGAGVVALLGIKSAQAVDKAAPSQGLFSLGNLLRGMTLATTALVAAPALLPALTMGIHYLSLLAGSMLTSDMDYFKKVSDFAIDHIGQLGLKDVAVSNGERALSTSTLLLSHVLTCGVAAGISGAAVSSSAHHISKAASPSSRVQPATAQVKRLIEPQVHAVSPAGQNFAERYVRSLGTLPQTAHI